MNKSVLIKNYIYIITHSKYYVCSGLINRYIIYKDDIQIGIIEELEDTTDKSKSHIAYLHVNDKFRNNGFGTYLIEYLSNKINSTQKVLHVVSSNNAKIFYEKNGFKKYRTWREKIMTSLFGNGYISNNEYYKILK
jgi:ribosomal protein S18 acetylase RimI-like enzyme